MLGPAAGGWLNRWRMQVATGLRSEGWDQKQIARMLGTTQSTVSRMFDRPLHDLCSAEDEAQVDRDAELTVIGLVRIGSRDQPVRQLIRLELITQQGEMMESAMELRGGHPAGAESRGRVLKDLRRAVETVDAPDLTEFEPEVGINIAACYVNAENTDEVAAFPGRLALIDGEFRTHARPEFGASEHLAEVLLAVRGFGDRKRRSIINLRPPSRESLTAACAGAGMSLADAPQGVPESGADVLYDAGAFGWEPSMYILGSWAASLASRLHSLITEIRRLQND